MPETLVANPMSVPRRDFETVFPSTSFAATEHIPRAKLNTNRAPNTSQLAFSAGKSRINASPQAKRAKPLSKPPNIHTYFRSAFALILAAINSWGSNTPDSRTGTASDINSIGAPSRPSTQGNTKRALAISSASLVKKLLSKCRKKLTGWCLQDSSGMSLHTRASSSPVIRSYKAVLAGLDCCIAVL